jgi:hypothetical protein
MDFGGLNWAMMTIAGVLVLAAALIWASLRNRSSQPRIQDSEEATRRLYEAEEREHRGESDHVP